MDEYLEHFTLFHDQRVKFLSGKEEYTKCAGGESLKKFQEGKILILSCGASNDSSKYGIQFKVTLPKYIKRDSEINEFKKKLMKGLDSKGFNFDILYKYDLISNLKENQDFVDEIKKGIELINTEYNKTNLGGKSTKIKEFYENRINLTKDLRQVENRIKSSDESELKELRQKYVGIVNQINSEFNDVQEFLQNINPYIMIDDPKVEIVNKDYKEILLNHKKKKKKDLPVKIQPGNKCKDLMCENEIYEGENAEKDFKKWVRKNHPDKKHGKDSIEREEIHTKFAEMNDCAQKDIFCPESERNKSKKSPAKKEPSTEKPPKKSPVKKEPSAEKPPKKSPAKKEPSAEKPPKKSPVKKEPSADKKTVTIDDFKEGMKVEWKMGNKILKGVVNKINKKKKKKIEILQEDGDTKEIDIIKLKILK
jgi:hypothetical protein